MQLWALTFVAKHAAPNTVVLFIGISSYTNLNLSSPAPASQSPAAQPTGFSPSATTRHDASRIGSYSEKLIPSAHIRILHAAWRGVDVTVSTGNTSNTAGSRRRLPVRPSVGGQPKHTCCDSINRYVYNTRQTLNPPHPLTIHKNNGRGATQRQTTGSWVFLYTWRTWTRGKWKGRQAAGSTNTRGNWRRCV